MLGVWEQYCNYMGVLLFVVHRIYRIENVNKVFNLLSFFILNES